MIIYEGVYIYISIKIKTVNFLFDFFQFLTIHYADLFKIYVLSFIYSYISLILGMYLQFAQNAVPHIGIHGR